MQLLINLFWLGLLIALALFVFKIAITLVIFLVGGVIALGAWIVGLFRNQGEY